MLGKPYRLSSLDLVSGDGGGPTLFTAIDSGPLPEAIANTFRGGSYTATTLSDVTTVYRAYGGTAGEQGSFGSRVAASGRF